MFRGKLLARVQLSSQGGFWSRPFLLNLLVFKLRESCMMLDIVVQPVNATVQEHDSNVPCMVPVQLWELRPLLLIRTLQLKRLGRQQ